jgi:hypothetical protein
MTSLHRFRRLLSMLAIVAGIGLRLALLAIDDDRTSALAAGALLLVCLFVCLRFLRLWLLTPPMLYLCVFSLFHLGMAVPWALGIYAEKLPDWFLYNRLTPALALVTLATASYCSGLLYSCRPNFEVLVEPAYANRFLFACGLFVYLAGGAMFFFGIQPLGGWRFFDAGYSETYRLAAEFDPRFFGTSFTLVPIGLYLAAAAFPRRWMPVAVCITAIWVGGIFFLGFRGYALIPGLVVLCVLRQRGYRAPAWTNAALACIVLVAIPIARNVRDRGLHQRSMEPFSAGVHPLAGIVEMGGSLRPLVHTLRYLESESWRWGKTYWQSLGTVWPNLAPRWEGGRYIALQDLPPNHWLTLQAEPEMYRNYGGLGFSAVAEPYMNFGVPGVILYFWGLGSLLGWAAGRRSRRPVRLAAWAMALGPLLWTTRNSFEIFFRPAVWGLIVVGAAWLASSLARSQTEASAGRAEPGEKRGLTVGPGRRGDSSARAYSQ